MLDEKKAAAECQKVIQQYMDACKFQNPEDAGKALGMLIMLATMALDSALGSEYASATILKVMEQMASGEPQKRVRVEMISRSKMH